MSGEGMIPFQTPAGVDAGPGVTLECFPPGTAARLAALEAYAREASAKLAELAGGGPYEIPCRAIGGQHYADPVVCAAKIEGKLFNARRRYSPVKGRP